MKAPFLIDTRNTGAGKTTRAINTLTEELEERLGKRFSKTILLTPYGRTRNQIEENHSSRVIDLFEYLNPRFGEDVSGRVIVATYAAISNAIANDSIDLRDSLIIFDELPTFLQFASWQMQQGPLLEYLSNPELFSSITAYGLTGTPQLLFNYFNKLDNLPYEFVDDTPDKGKRLTAKAGKFIVGGSARTYSRSMIQRGLDGKAVIYVDNSVDAVALYHLFNEAGYTAGFLVSEGNENWDKKTEQEYNALMRSQVFEGRTLSEWIEGKCQLPPQVDVFIFNACARDGINIFDNEGSIKEIVIQSACRMTIEQARARVRHDVDKLTIIYNRQDEKHAISSLADCAAFLQQEQINQTVLETRYKAQCGSADEVEAFKQRRKNAQRDKQPFNETRPIALDFIVHKGRRGYFINPFIEALTWYERDNYAFSKVIHRQEGALEIEDKYEAISKFTGKLPTLREFIDSLRPLTNNVTLEVVYGYNVVQEVRNAESLSRERIIELLNLEEGISRKITSTELKKIAASAELITSDRHKAGKETLLDELKKCCDVERKRSKSQRYYLLRLKG